MYDLKIFLVFILESIEDSSCEMVSPEYFLQHGTQLLYSDDNSMSAPSQDV